MKYTLTNVKFTLPDVQVRIEGGKIVTAIVRGRRLAYPSVILPDGRSLEYAWQTIIDSLNNDRPLAI